MRGTPPRELVRLTAWGQLGHADGRYVVAGGAAEEQILTLGVLEGLEIALADVWPRWSNA